MAACTDDGDDPAADPQPTTTTPSTTQSQTEEDEQSLRQLAEDWYATSDDIYRGEADPEAAREFLVDPYLTAYIERATQVIDAGQLSRPSERSRFEVTEVEVQGDRGTVVECSIDADVLVGPNGEVVNDDVVASLLESDAVRQDGKWMFSDRRSLAEVPGSDQCPAA